MKVIVSASKKATKTSIYGKLAEELDNLDNSILVEIAFG